MFRIFGRVARRAALDFQSAINLRLRAAVGENQFHGTGPLPLAVATGVGVVRGMRVNAGVGIEQIGNRQDQRHRRNGNQPGANRVRILRVVHDGWIHFVIGPRSTIHRSRSRRPDVSGRITRRIIWLPDDVFDKKKSLRHGERRQKIRRKSRRAKRRGAGDVDWPDVDRPVGRTAADARHAAVGRVKNGRARRCRRQRHIGRLAEKSRSHAHI